MINVNVVAQKDKKEENVNFVFKKIIYSINEKKNSAKKQNFFFSS